MYLEPPPPIEGGLLPSPVSDSALTPFLSSTRSVQNFSTTALSFFQPLDLSEPGPSNPTLRTMQSPHWNSLTFPSQVWELAPATERLERTELKTRTCPQTPLGFLPLPEVDGPFAQCVLFCFPQFLWLSSQRNLWGSCL